MISTSTTTSPKALSRTAKTQFYSPVVSHRSSFRNIQIKLNKTTSNLHYKTKKNGLKSLNILNNNIGNVRYPGFSEFISENSLQNSSYCWSFTRDRRFKIKQPYTHSIYSIPSFRSTKYTTFGIGLRKTLKEFNSRGDSPSPDTYHIKSIFDFNKERSKGFSIGVKRKVNDSEKTPGVGTYNISTKQNTSKIPIKIKSRVCFFYDDDLRKTKHCVSMQRYSPKMDLVQGRRFHNISFGIGGRSPSDNRSVRNYPGPGSYNIPGCFDRGYRGKPPLN